MATNDSEYGRALMQFLEQEKGMQRLTFRVYAGIVGDIARREEGIMIMIVEGTGMRCFDLIEKKTMGRNELHQAKQIIIRLKS